MKLEIGDTLVGWLASLFAILAIILMLFLEGAFATTEPEPAPCDSALADTTRAEGR